jgi:hypothetical protein
MKPAAAFGDARAAPSWRGGRGVQRSFAMFTPSALARSLVDSSDRLSAFDRFQRHELFRQHVQLLDLLAVSHLGRG